MCQKLEFAGWAHLKSKVTPYCLRNFDTPHHPRLRATSRDKAELAEPWSVPGRIESFTASRPAAIRKATRSRVETRSGVQFHVQS